MRSRIGGESMRTMTLNGFDGGDSLKILKMELLLCTSDLPTFTPLDGLFCQRISCKRFLLILLCFVLL